MGRGTTAVNHGGKNAMDSLKYGYTTAYMYNIVFIHIINIVILML